MAEIEDKLLGSNYDGIQEFDNPMPGWWISLFIITVVWSLAYVIYFEITDLGDSQLQAYENELAAAAVKAEKREKMGGGEQMALVALSDAQSLNKGKEIYMTNCASCHLNDGGGSVGPNLTDNYWIHGGSFEDIVKIINEGVPEKGMISWKTMLKKQQIVQVASYIKNEIVGTTPANPKEAQGELYEGE